MDVLKNSAIFIICILLFSESFAADTKQKKSRVQQATEYSDLWNSKSVFERVRMDYENDSPRFGAFKFKPSVDLEEKYDSNIYASESNQTEDFVTSIKPQLSLESDWNNHAISVTTSGDFTSYADKASENYNDYSFGSAGRLDIFRETYLLGSVTTSHKHEDRGGPDSVAGAKKPTEYNQTDANISFIRALRKISLKIDGDYTKYNYQNSVTNSGVLIDNVARNRNEYKATTRLGYEIIPEYEAFIKTSMNERGYEFIPILSGVNRNSSGYELEVGTALNLGGRTRGEVFVGFMGQDYDAASLKDIKGTDFGGNLLWNITTLTSIKSSIIRGVQETTEVDSSGYISTLYSLGLEHELLYNVLLGANIHYNTNDYVSLATIARKDEIKGADFQVKYLMGRSASIVVKYDYTNRESNFTGQDYSRDMITLGIKMEM